MLFTWADFGWPFVWGLLILAAWLGWGGLARRAAGLSRRRADWGLLAGWGMAVELGLAGLLELGHRCNGVALTAMVIAGAVLFAIWLIGRLGDLRKRLARPGIVVRRWLPLAPVLVILAFLYLTSIQTPRADPWDDLSAYFPMARRLLQTGVLLDPYSVRRLLTYGGQQVFDAMLLSHSSMFNIDLLELGLARIVFAGLLLGMIYKGGSVRRWAAGLIVGALLLVPVPHVNMHSEMTGVVLLLTLLRTFQLQALEIRPVRRAMLMGIVAAGLAVFRMSFVPAAGLAVVFAYFTRWPRKLAARKKVMRELAVTLTAFLVLLLPWAIVLYESSGSLIYPLMRGTQRPDYDYIHAGLTLGQTLSWVAGILWHWQVIALLLPVLFWRNNRRENGVAAFYGAAFLTALMTFFTYTLTDYEDLYRFIFPALFAVAAAGIARWAVGRTVPAICAWVFAGLLIAATAARTQTLWAYDTPLNRWEVLRDGAHSPMLAVMAERPAYEAAQSKVPAGSKIFAAVTAASLFDYQRNDVLTVDMVGGASPDPGMPLLAGAAAVKAYLKNQGIDYVIFSDFARDTAHVSRAVWSRAASDPDAQTPAFRRVYRFNLALMDDFDELARTEELLQNQNGLLVIRLR